MKNQLKYNIKVPKKSECSLILLPNSKIRTSQDQGFDFETSVNKVCCTLTPGAVTL